MNQTIFAFYVRRHESEHWKFIDIDTQLSKLKAKAEQQEAEGYQWRITDQHGDTVDSARMRRIVAVTVWRTIKQLAHQQEVQ